MKNLIIIPMLLFLTACGSGHIGRLVRHTTSYEFGIIKSSEHSEEHNNQIVYTVELFNPFNGQPIYDPITGKSTTRKWLQKEWVSVTSASIDQLIRQCEKLEVLKKKYEE